MIIPNELKIMSGETLEGKVCPGCLKKLERRSSVYCSNT